MQNVSSIIWTGNAVSIFYDGIHYTTNVSKPFYSFKYSYLMRIIF